MWNQFVEEQEKERSDPEADCGGQKGKVSEPAFRALFEGGNQETPDRGRDHDTGRKAGQRPLNVSSQGLFQKEDSGCAERGAGKRNQNAEKTVL